MTESKGEPLWQPSASEAEDCNLTQFERFLSEHYGVGAGDYDALHAWSIDHMESFWEALWTFCDVRGERTDAVVLENRDQMPGARWFPGARINFAENLLRRDDDGAAIIFNGEGRVSRTISYRGLHDQVSRTQQALRCAGVEPGDRVVGYLPNMPETIVAMLAATSLGATWSSCSPDFGAAGVVDRFGQIAPKVMFCADGYFYNGQSHDSLDKVREICERIESIETVVVIPYSRRAADLRVLGSHQRKARSWDSFTLEFRAVRVEYTRLPFDHPLYVMYSSGTTGVPKCIVHGAGGTLLQHLKEHRFHADVRSGDHLFYFTTCGWMMWNWLVSGLACDACLVLYDGSPFYPDASALFDYAEAAEVGIFGTSAKYLDAIKKAEFKPVESNDTSAIRSILSTGSPLAEETFDYVYDHVAPHARLSSITGGTDIIGCFVQGNPKLPVWRGELQCMALGMKVEVFDDAGQAVLGEKGELVCTAPFPSMPIGFWNDPDDSKYHKAYFDKYAGVWCHGDYVAITEHGGMIVYGRSDAVLNPGGVRIGTAEIYRQVEQLDEVVEGLVIGQDWDDDVRVVLFVVLRGNTVLDSELEDKIRKQIRAQATPRHVPARIVQVSDIPRTKSGKIVELAVREVVHGREVKNREALANPEALALYRDLAELSR